MSAVFENPVPPLSGFSDSELENEEDFVPKSSPSSSSNVLRPRKRASVRVPADDVATRSSPENERSIPPDGLMSSSSSSYNWVSCCILVLSIAFFLCVFVYYFINSSYFIELKSSSPHTPAPFADSSSNPFDDMITKLKSPLCSESPPTHGNGPCISSRSDIRPALLVVQNMRQLFEKKLLHHFCSSGETAAAAGDEDYSDDPEFLTLSELRAKIAPNLMSSKTLDNLYINNPSLTSGGDDSGSHRVALIHKAVQDAVTLIRLNPEFRIRAIIGRDGEVSGLQVNAGNFPVTWPIGCRIRMVLTNALLNIAIVACIILVTVIIYYLFASRKERKHQEQRLFLELLEKSLELLQSPDEPGSMPVLHIRDTLISPTERKDQNLMKIWAQVVRHIETEESRVKVDMEEIEGETFKTWKWLCSNLSSESPAGGSLMTGTIEWQGQAFNERDGPAKQTSVRTAASDVTDANFTAPTAFLKVRNMFDEETVATANSKNDSYWKTRIMNAIIEKCAITSGDGHHGVYHLFVDERNAKEGLVYVMCRDQRTATSAYRALHGWWCDKRLVSVRFLKDDRYFYRFPDARNARSELRLEPVLDED
jgi:membrane protein Man1